MKQELQQFYLIQTASLIYLLPSHVFFIYTCKNTEVKSCSLWAPSLEEA